MDYKKILEGVVDIINATEKSDIGFANICTYIGKNCPELKESEDERIRTKLLNLLKELLELGGVAQDTWSMNDCEQFIAWLEKQGEQIPVNSEKTCKDERIMKSIIGFLKTIASLKNGRTVSNEDFDSKELLNWATWLEKQGEQNPTNTIKPNFNVGEWIIFNENHNSIYQVEGMDNYRYCLRHYLGGSFSVHFDNELIRLWTIKDAKDGDVLAADPIKGIEGFSSSFIAIYKKRNGEDFDSYCFVGFNGKFDKSGIEHSTDNIHPATKEQRDLLFQKMEEAGYEWNEEEKKLEEIKYNKIKWKKSDEEIIKGIKNFIALNQDLVEGGVDEWLNWLKNLENKVQLQSKKEWSEEDEVGLSDALWCCNQAASIAKDENDMGNCWYAERFLKSLKERYTWKTE